MYHCANIISPLFFCLLTSRFEIEIGILMMARAWARGARCAVPVQCVQCSGKLLLFGLVCQCLPQQWLRDTCAPHPHPRVVSSSREQGLSVSSGFESFLDSI